MATTKRWRVTLDYGLQYSTVYTMAIDESAARSQVQANYGQRGAPFKISGVELAADQHGIVGCASRCIRVAA